MNTKPFALLFVAVLLFSAFTMIETVLWKPTETYTVKFTSDKFDGVFKGLKSDIRFDENNLAASKIKASIDPSTVNTGNGMRNKHAQQGLDTKKFPTISFESTSISKTATGYEAVGNLSIKDVTKSIKLPFTFTKTASGAVFAGKFSITPADYNVTKAGTPKTLEIVLDIPVTQ